MISVEKTERMTRLADWGQQHLLDHWDVLDEQGQAQLAKQIDEVDLALIDRLWKQSGTASTDWRALAEKGRTPKGIRLHEKEPMFSESHARAVGERAIREGSVAAILVAGGQGSRLGFPHPKGMYQIGPVSSRTLFEIFADQIVATTGRFESTLPLYLMTSPATHVETVEYFVQNDYLGLPKNQVEIFCQGTMPAVDAETGKVLMDGPGHLFESPDGHGGTLAALARSGCLDGMMERGIKYLFYFQVDNPLVCVADPIFLGYHILSKSEMSTHVIAKDDPLEKVGNVVSIDDHLQIIEYSDLPEEAACRRNEDGSLALWAGSIAVHAFDVAFLARVQDRQDALPFHLANKKVSYLAASGETIVPTQPNAIKFERFIFDLLPLAENAIVVEVDPQEGFAPLKNASGAAKDTPESTRSAIAAQHARWLRTAGATLAKDVIVEVNPRFALNVAELADKLQPGLELTEDRYFGP